MKNYSLGFFLIIFLFLFLWDFKCSAALSILLVLLNIFAEQPDLSEGGGLITFELTRCALNRDENISLASEGEMSSQPREKAVGPMMDSNSASIASHSRPVANLSDGGVLHAGMHVRVHR